MPVIASRGAMSVSALGGIGGGVAAPVTLETGAIINGQSNLKQITASDYINNNGTIIVPTNFWVWSDSTSTAALTIDIPCTIENYGKIIGRGGNGANNTANGGAGGPAIKINSGVSGVTIINYSGSYIAGGGGGGAGGHASDPGGGGAGGGGAGGGTGGTDSAGANTGTGGAGGVLNAVGANGNGPGSPRATGGGAGGGGSSTSGGGGGGRQLPGSAGQAANDANDGDGASAGNTGDSGIYAGGGGGWGAAGGNSTASTGGAGGKAIEDSGNSYTLTNSGTIYGATT